MKDKLLVFIPHAGGSCLSYSRLLTDTPPEVEVKVLDLPGRNQFKDDPWPIPWEELIPALYERIRGETRPLIVLGHSFGALVALELADHCARRGHHLVLGLSGMSAPTITYWERREKISRLPEIEFVEKLRKLGALPEDLPREFLHLIKSDFTMMERFPLRERRRLPALAFAGTEDPITTRERMEAWSELVELKRPPIFFSGNHFQFFQGHIEPIMEELIKIL